MFWRMKCNNETNAIGQIQCDKFNAINDICKIPYGKYCDKCNVRHDVWQMICDKGSVTNTIWQMQHHKCNVTIKLWKMLVEKCIMINVIW